MKKFAIFVIILLFLINYNTSSYGKEIKFKFEIKFEKPVIKNGIICLKPAQSHIYIPGYPILPVFRKTFVLPPVNKIDIKYKIEGVEKSEIAWDEIAKCPKPFPSIPIIHKYNKDWFEYRIGRGILNNEEVTFLTINVYPIKYEDLTYIKKIEIEVKYSKIATRNREGLLIITPKEFLDDLEEFLYYFVDCKKIISLDEIYNNYTGRDLQEKIKYCIKDAIEKEGIKYALLIGNKNKVPVRYIESNFSSNFSISFFTDLYYADIYDSSGFCSWDTNNNSIFGEFNETTFIDKVDLYPDVYIGRLLCNSSQEIKVVMNKMINYRPGEWFNRIILCGGNTHQDWKDLFGMFLYKARICWEGEYMGDLVADRMQNFGAIKIYSTGLIRKDAYFLSKKNINEMISEGAGFVFFAGHGSPVSWATHPPIFGFIWLPLPLGYTVSDIDLNNKEKLPVIVFSACSTGDFNYTDNPIAWEFIRREEGGGIASYTSTAVAFLYPGSICTESLNGYISMDIFKLYMKGIRKAGDLWGYSIIDYLNNAMSGDLFLDYITIAEWELFGNPSLEIGQL